MPIDLTPFSPDELAASEQRTALALRRGNRLFGDNGPMARYERRGNPLFELALITGLLADKVPYAVVVARFLASAKAGGFGWRTYPDGHRVVAALVDTFSFSDTRFEIPRGTYSLRPTLYTVEISPEAMRARKTTWRRWVEAMRWEMPDELLPPAMMHNEAEARTAFLLLIEDERETIGRPGTRSQHRQWARKQGPFYVTDELIEKWRKLALTEDERRGGRRRK